MSILFRDEVTEAIYTEGLHPRDRRGKWTLKPESPLDVPHTMTRSGLTASISFDLSRGHPDHTAELSYDADGWRLTHDVMGERGTWETKRDSRISMDKAMDYVAPHRVAQAIVPIASKFGGADGKRLRRSLDTALSKRGLRIREGSAVGLLSAEIAEAEAHRKVKCPKCDHVVSATNKECPNCGHDLTDARKAKFAQEAGSLLFESPEVAEAVAAGVFDEAKHPRGGHGQFRDVLGHLTLRGRHGTKVTVHERPHGSSVQGSRAVPAMFKEGDRVILPDGRHGTVASAIPYGDEPRYVVDTTPGEPGSQAWKDEQIYHDGKYVRRETALASVRKAAQERFKGTTYHEESVKRVVDEFLNDHWNRPGRTVERKEVAHSKLRYHPDEMAAKQEAITGLLAKADKATGKAAPAFKPAQRPVTIGHHSIPDEWKIERGYGEFVNPDNRNPEVGAKVAFMPGTEHHGKTGVVERSAYSDRGSGRTLTDVTLDGGGKVSVPNNDVHSAERPPWVRMKPGAPDAESMLYEYLTGKRPHTKYPPGTPGHEQWAYKGAKASERADVIRRLTEQAFALLDEDGFEALLLLNEALLLAYAEDGIALAEYAHATEFHFNPSLHPRDRKGEFADVLGRLTRRNEVTMPGGIVIKKGVLGGDHFHVQTRGGSFHVIGVEKTAQRALAAHDRDAPHLSVIARLHPGEPVEARTPKEIDDLSSVLDNLGYTHEARRVANTGRLNPDNVIDTHLDEIASTMRSSGYGHHRLAGQLESEISARQMRDSSGGSFGDVLARERHAAANAPDRLAGFRDVLARERVEGGRVSKAQAMVDAGLADDLRDARAQLADMGETGGLNAPRSDEQHVAQGIADWRSNAAYRDKGGNYRLKSTKRVAPWNRAVKARFPDSHELHRAAHPERDFSKYDAAVARFNDRFGNFEQR